jgi:hypothetical protein
MRRIPLTAASYSASSLIASAQRCVNLYPEANPPDSPAPFTFYGTPGRVLWSTMPGSDGVRGLWEVSNGQFFGVRGSTLYRYSAGAWVFVATLATHTGPVYAADNGIVCVFVDGSMTAPTYNLTSLVAGLMAGEGWYGADFVDFLDGFFIFNKPGTQQFYISSAYGVEIDALDFASSESQPDLLVRSYRDHAELWLFGTESTEVFANVGDTFPFGRIGGSVMEIGCSAPHSVAKLDNSVVWLGGGKHGDGMVFRAQGYSPVPISTRALESELRTYPTISDAQAYSYQQDGHWFYVLTFPLAGKTWAYDASTMQWAERAYRTPANLLTRVRDNCHVFYGRRHFVGDWENGNIYELSLDAFTDNGDEIPRIKSFQHMSADGVRQFFKRLVLDMQAGVTGEVSLRWSDDGGFTWSALLTVPLGLVGQYSNKPCFNRLGMGRDRVFEVSTSASSKIVLQGAFVEAQLGTS